jgi:diphthamide synthase (EF-2-diphthine--ammonia ligase)
MDLEITLSTELVMSKETLAAGTSYTEELVQRLKESGLDAMLENGEAHTLVFPRAWKVYQ